MEAALLARIEPRWRATCESILHGRNATFAQAWQDWYLWHNIFKDTAVAGFYVEIGVWDPLRLSSTLFFDKCLGNVPGKSSLEKPISHHPSDKPLEIQ